jgi:hypothetical protein
MVVEKSKPGVYGKPIRIRQSHLIHAGRRQLKRPASRRGPKEGQLPEIRRGPEEGLDSGSSDYYGSGSSDYYYYSDSRYLTEHPMKRWNSSSVSQKIKEFDDYFANMEGNMHTLPPALSSFRKRYGKPVAMPIGPYAGTWSRDTVTTVKDVATHHFRSGTTFGSVGEMFNDFCSAVGDVRRLCQHDDDYFRRTYGQQAVNDDALLKFNMLRDGCFLVEYMQVCTTDRNGRSTPTLLECYIDSNEAAIDRDIMLLENQVPWVVIKTLLGYKPQVPIEVFVAKMARMLQVRRAPDDSRLPNIEGTEPPHLLGLVLSYKIGR